MRIPFWIILLSLGLSLSSSLMLWSYQDELQFAKYRFLAISKKADQSPHLLKNPHLNYQKEYHYAHQNWTQFQEEESRMLLAIGLFLFITIFLITMKIKLNDLNFTINAWQLFFILMGYALFSILFTLPLLSDKASPINNTLSNLIISSTPLPLAYLVIHPNEPVNRKILALAFLLGTLFFVAIYLFVVMMSTGGPIAPFG